MVWISKGKILISFVDSILICHLYNLDIFLKKGSFSSWWPSSCDDLQNKFSISFLWLGRHSFPVLIHWSHNVVNVHLLASFPEIFLLHYRLMTGIFYLLWMDIYSWFLDCSLKSGFQLCPFLFDSCVIWPRICQLCRIGCCVVSAACYEVAWIKIFSAEQWSTAFSVCLNCSCT